MPRVNISISDELKNYFEELSKETGASQSSLMALALKEYYEQKKIVRELPSIFSKISELEKEFKKKS